MTETTGTTEAFPYESYMVVVAHPDDLEFSCGGTIAKLAMAGPPRDRRLPLNRRPGHGMLAFRRSAAGAQ